MENDTNTVKPTIQIQYDAANIGLTTPEEGQRQEERIAAFRHFLYSAISVSGIITSRIYDISNPSIEYGDIYANALNTEGLVACLEFGADINQDTAISAAKTLAGRIELRPPEDLRNPIQDELRSVAFRAIIGIPLQLLLQGNPTGAEAQLNTIINTLEGRMPDGSSLKNAQGEEVQGEQALYNARQVLKAELLEPVSVWTGIVANWNPDSDTILARLQAGSTDTVQLITNLKAMREVITGYPAQR